MAGLFVECGGISISEVEETSVNQNSCHCEELVEHNRKSHDLVADEYDSVHIEIFNPTEQNRIKSVLGKAFNCLVNVSGQLKALDFGSGTGNLTKHLLDLGLEVTSADVSPVCLAKIDKKFGNGDKLSTHLLNGKDLANIPDNSFDLVATYSVLHHVPDYLSIIDEFVRVSKPNGIIVIDHEVCPSYWRNEKKFFSYLEELGRNFYSDHLYELGITAEPKYGGLFRFITPIKKIYSFCALNKQSKNKSENNERLMSLDGDVHVFMDDHIEWDTIRSRLRPHCDFLVDEDYLVCRERSEPPPVWHKWCDKVSDMHLVMARKR